MPAETTREPPDALPAVVERVLSEFVAAARAAFREDLVAAVLYGSAAEGRLRPASDVNLILVLSAFGPEAAAAVAEALRVGQAAVRLEVMFLLQSEIGEAERAFAAKFADVGRRRRVLYGADPFASQVIPREAEVARLRQVLLNLGLRWRTTYVSRLGRDDAMTRAVAEAAGPLRSMAATLLELEDGKVRPPREALLEVAGEEARGAIERLPLARSGAVLPEGTAGPTLLALMRLAEAMRQRALRLQ